MKKHILLLFTVALFSIIFTSPAYSDYYCENTTDSSHICYAQSDSSGWSCDTENCDDVCCENGDCYYDWTGSASTSDGNCQCEFENKCSLGECCEPSSDGCADEDSNCGYCDTDGDACEYCNNGDVWVKYDYCDSQCDNCQCTGCSWNEDSCGEEVNTTCGSGETCVETGECSAECTTLGNIRPNPPTNLKPSGSILTLSPSLSAKVTDPDNTTLNLYFYNDNTDSEICHDLNVQNASRGSCKWTGLSEGNSYTFYAKAYDGSKWSDESSRQTFNIPELCTYLIKVTGEYGTWDEMVGELSC